MSARGGRTARVIVLGGVSVSVGLTLFLVVTNSLPWPDAVLSALLLVLLPALAVGQLPLAEAEDLQRVPAYAASAATIGLLASLCWLVGTRSGGPTALRFVAVTPATLVVWTLLLAVAGLAIELLFRQLGLALGWAESPLLEKLLPRTTGERWAFVALSLVAGFGEEIVYRGYAIPVLGHLVGDIGAVALASAVFGVLHAYQGSVGIARTALMGAVLAWGLLATGSLWPPIAAHALIDVVAGVFLAEWLMVPRRPDGVPLNEERDALRDE